MSQKEKKKAKPADPEEEGVMAALEKVKNGPQEEENTSITEVSEDDNTKFREWYIQQLTACFGEEIDGLRKDSDAFTGTADDISNLVAALRAGESSAVFEAGAKKIVLNSLKVSTKSKKSKTDK